MSKKYGLWLVGACGGVGTTIALGLAALARKVTDTTSLVTELPLFEGIELAEADQFVVGGHEIREAGFRQTASEMHERAGVFHESLLAACSDTLAAWEKNLRAGTLVACGETIAKLADRPEVNAVETPAKAIERIKADIADFKTRHNLDDVVVLSVASTEPPFPTGPEHQSLAVLEPLLTRANNPVLPASSLYAYAALDLGLHLRGQHLAHQADERGPIALRALRELHQVRRPAHGVEGLEHCVTQVREPVLHALRPAARHRRPVQRADGRRRRTDIRNRVPQRRRAHAEHEPDRAQHADRGQARPAERPVVLGDRHVEQRQRHQRQRRKPEDGGQRRLGPPDLAQQDRDAGRPERAAQRDANSGSRRTASGKGPSTR